MDNKAHFIKVVKFNNNYFEHGDIVSIITHKKEAFVGRLIITKSYNGDSTCEDCLALDVSEKFYHKRKFIGYEEIKEIYRINS